MVLTWAWKSSISVWKHKWLEKRENFLKFFKISFWSWKYLDPNPDPKQDLDPYWSNMLYLDLYWSKYEFETLSVSFIPVLGIWKFFFFWFGFGIGSCFSDQFGFGSFRLCIQTRMLSYSDSDRSQNKPWKLSLSKKFLNFFNHQH